MLHKGQLEAARNRLVAQKADRIHAGRKLLASDLQNGRGFNRRMARRAIYGDDRASMLASGRERRHAPVNEAEDSTARDTSSESSPLQIVTAKDLLKP
jgi:hypothetical protein